jgi:hypothetical protein
VTETRHNPVGPSRDLTSHGPSLLARTTSFQRVHMRAQLAVCVCVYSRRSGSPFGSTRRLAQSSARAHRKSAIVRERSPESEGLAREASSWQSGLVADTTRCSSLRNDDTRLRARRKVLIFLQHSFVILRTDYRESVSHSINIAEDNGYRESNVPLCSGNAMRAHWRAKHGSLKKVRTLSSSPRARGCVRALSQVVPFLRAASAMFARGKRLVSKESNQ